VFIAQARDKFRGLFRWQIRGRDVPKPIILKSSHSTATMGSNEYRLIVRYVWFEHSAKGKLLRIVNPEQDPVIRNAIMPA
jgi:hypothetical protein